MLVIVLESKNSSIVRAFFGLECKTVDSIVFSSWLWILARICSILMFSQITLISAYWFNVLSKPSLISHSVSQVASIATNLKAIYSAFVNNKAIIAYFLAYQLTKRPFNIKKKQEVDFIIA